jgi:NADH-quinone oxidoreductase subunit L
LEKWLEHSLYGVQPAKFTLMVALISLAVALTGLLVGWLVYGRKPLEDTRQPDPLARPLNGLFLALENKWWVDELYQVIVVKPYLWLAQFLAQPVDQGVIDGLVNGVGHILRSTAKSWRRIQNGYVRSYALTILLGVVLVVTYLVLR